MMHGRTQKAAKRACALAVGGLISHGFWMYPCHIFLPYKGLDGSVGVAVSGVCPPCWDSTENGGRHLAT